MKCLEKDCLKDVLAKGLCGMHYRRAVRAASPALRAREVAQTKAWKAANPEKHAAQQARKHLRQKEELNAYAADWKRAHKEQVNANTRARKTRLRVSGPDRKNIQAFYMACPEGSVVDHVVPINHTEVSGLHCLANLQYLTVEENSYKSNKFDGTYANEGWRKNTP